MTDVLNCHCVIEEMAVLVSMAKNKNIDRKVMSFINKDVRKYYASLFKVAECSWLHRISALICLVSPMLLLWLSMVRYTFQKNELY